MKNLIILKKKETIENQYRMLTKLFTSSYTKYFSSNYVPLGFKLITGWKASAMYSGVSNTVLMKILFSVLL